MALSATASLDFRPVSGPVVVPVQGICPWVNAVIASAANDGPAAADASPITNPTTQITSSTRRIIDRKQIGGTFLIARLGYAAAASTITSPVVNVFGRASPTDPWMRLQNKNGETNATLTADSTNDVSDGTLKYTAVTDDHWFDMSGCEEFLIGVVTAYNATSNEGTNSVIQVKGA